MRWTPDRWRAAFVWNLAASVAAWAAPVAAQSGRIDLPAAPLAQSLSRLSGRTGVSIGYAGRLPSLTARAVHGANSAADALRQMLAGSGYRATATGPTSFRIESVPVAAPKARRAVAPVVAPLAPQPDIVVTALKRAVPLLSVPATVQVITEGDLRVPGGVAGSDALAAELPSVSISSLGPGRNRLFLRGVGDGPLNGFNQGSVAILLDEARLNYDAPDPDWALIDIDQVEVLEGPQGPLYGTGALGGIVKITTRPPSVDRAEARLHAGLAVTQDGDLSNSQSAILNAPLAYGQLAVRVVAYRQHQAGWIDTFGGARDSNAEDLSGGRVTLRGVFADGWSIDLTGALQGRRARDSQYVDGNLGALERPRREPEPRDLDARLAKLTVKGLLGGLELTSVTAVSGQEATAVYDATPLATVLGTKGTTLVEDDRDYHLFDQEVRISSAGDRPASWLVGASLIRASTKAAILAKDSGQVLPVLKLKRSVSEAALFGQAGMALSPSLRLEGGARLFISNVDDESQEGGSVRLVGKRRFRGAGSVSLAWRHSHDRAYFIRAATAYRPGGANIQTDSPHATYEADELASIEAGARVRLGRAWSIDSTAFAARWQHVQADELLGNGLIATRNAGNGRNFGVEADVKWNPLPRTEISTGMMIQSARLEGGSGSGIEDPRLPAVPHAALRVRASHEFQLGRWDAKAGAGLQYVGATHISFDPGLDRRTAGWLRFDASFDLTNGDWTIGLSGQNLTNSSVDTFAFGNPYRVRALPQRTPLRPRTIGLSVSRRL